MFLCYVDESGDAGTLTPGNPTDCPLFIVGALIVDRSFLPRITHDFIQLKHRFYPGATTGTYLDSIRDVSKGAKLRSAIRKGPRRNRTHAIGYLDKLMDLVGRYHIQLIAKGLVKGVGAQNSDEGFYGSAMMHVCEHFQAYLGAHGDDLGQIVADSRRKAQNTRTTHTVFTQMYRAQGNSYPNLTEMPTYGHPDNHAMLQITDSICSGILFPMFSDAYCGALVSDHVSLEYALVRDRYKTGVKNMQYRHCLPSGQWRGGILVVDGAGQGRNATVLFR